MPLFIESFYSNDTVVLHFGVALFAGVNMELGDVDFSINDHISSVESSVKLWSETLGRYYLDPRAFCSHDGERNWGVIYPGGETRREDVIGGFSQWVKLWDLSEHPSWSSTLIGSTENISASSFSVLQIAL